MLDKPTKEEVQKYAFADIRKYAYKFLRHVSKLNGINLALRYTYTEDTFNAITDKVTEKRNETKEMYDNRPLPETLFTYPDHIKEDEVIENIYRGLTEELFKTNLIKYLTEYDKLLLQLRHMILWNVACIRYELGIELEDERKIMLMTTNVLIYHMCESTSSIKGEQYKLLSYVKDCINLPEVNKFMIETGLITLIKED